MHNDKYMRKLSHETNENSLEALQKAISGTEIPSHLDVIHVGESHIHIFSSTSETPYAIPNGILDLNQQFSLRKSPNQRQIAMCIKWLSCRLPPTLQTFACIGTGLTALRYSQIELEQDLYCLRDDFILFAQQTALQEVQTPTSDSPSKPAWVQEVVALHCVILAGLFKSGASKFMPYTF